MISINKKKIKKFQIFYPFLHCSAAELLQTLLVYMHSRDGYTAGFRVGFLMVITVDHTCAMCVETVTYSLHQKSQWQGQGDNDHIGWQRSITVSQLTGPHGRVTRYYFDESCRFQKKLRSKENVALAPAILYLLVLPPPSLSLHGGHTPPTTHHYWSSQAAV